MDKKDFIPTIAPIVQAENKKRGYPLYPSVVIAQAVCESAWGQSKLMMKANAIFGIKATSSWSGKVYNAKTKECYDGKTYTTITDCFRAYDSLQDSISDYFDLICKSARYSKALFSISPEACIKAIKNGGYATSPTYVETIMSIIRSNNLTKYDTKNETVSQQTSKNYVNYKVVKGDTLSSIAKKFGTTYERIAKDNGIENPNLIYPNQVLKIYTDVPKQTNKNYITYKVVKGDTLSYIAKKFGTTYQQIAKDNGIKNPNLIHPNQVLKIYI